MTLARRLLAGSAIVVTTLVAAVVLIAGGRLRDRLVDEKTDELARAARAVAAAWVPAADAEVLARQMGAALGYRVTLVDPTGVVVGDSEFERDARRRLENHFTRPEIAEARAAGLGSSRRHSASVGNDELYVAVRHPRGFARVSITTRRLDEIVDGAQRDVFVAGLVGLLGVLALAVLFARTVSQPVVELRDVARAIAGGDLTRRPALTAPGEVGDLATALHRMAEQLDARLQALRRDDALMTALLESLEEGVLALDERGDVVRINARARALLALDTALPCPREVLPREAVLRAAIDRARAGDVTGPEEATLLGRPVSVSSRPLSPSGAVVTVLDLTALRRLETVRRDFVANVSHELKTPLTAVGGFAETLLDDDVPPDQRRRFLVTIRDNAARMQRIVDDLLDLSRIESGGWRPEARCVEIAAAIADALSTMQSEAHARGLTLAIDVAPDAAQVHADPTALRQIVCNLVENAVRYTVRGGVTVRTRRAAGGVRVEVVDTGVGIAPEHLPRIFERFYRVDAGRSRAQGGTGLGLAIVKHLVDAHEGRIDTTSEPGRGTRIGVFLPDAPG